jgi:hypothetical protein
MNRADPGVEREAREDQLTRMVREGVKPETVRDRLTLAGDKLVGAAPLGVDAPSKTARKVIGGGGELLAAIKLGVFGGLLVLLGVPVVLVGFGGGFDWKAIGLGAAMLALGAWSLRSAWHAWRNFRAISKA